LAIPDLWIDVQTLLDLDEVADEFKKKKKKLLRVATKYPNLTRQFLYSKGVTQFQLVQSLGSTEVAPFTGTAEIISDITSTGATLKANNLRVLKDGEILKSQACLMQSKLSKNKKGLKKLVRIKSWASCGVDPALMGTGPIPSSKKALDLAGWSVKDLDIVEANEAFAAQSIAVLKTLGIPEEKVNVNGGAIALGHPIGASGTRILVTLIHEMIKREAKKGLATLCIGGGMGIAMCIER